MVSGGRAADRLERDRDQVGTSILTSTAVSVKCIEATAANSKLTDSELMSNNTTVNSTHRQDAGLYVCQLLTSKQVTKTSG